MNDLYDRIKSELTEVGSDSDKLYYKCIEDFNEIIKNYPEEVVKVACDNIIKSFENKPWNKINLSLDKFNDCIHQRCIYIRLDNKGIYNIHAFASSPKRRYLFENDRGIEQDLEKSIINKYIDKIYISKGGIVNGDYIERCYVKSSDYYLVRDAINIPTSLIIDITDEKYYHHHVVDHREPKLKALMEFYEVPIKHDDEVKFNIRQFKKLK